MNVIPFRPRVTPVPSQPLKTSFISGRMPVGIDLGTTHSVVSVVPTSGNPETLVYDDAYLVPSLVFWDPEKGQEWVGQKAKLQPQTASLEVIKSSKRRMGQRHASFHSNGKIYHPEDVAQSILKYLGQHEKIQNDLQKNNPEVPLSAVVTVPAHFNDGARQATVLAAKEAGIDVLRIINEPTAAALAYSLLPGVETNDQETLVVYDFGGGTFDVSVVHRDGLVFNVLSSEGHVTLGGDDVDTALAESLLSRVQVKQGHLVSSKNKKILNSLHAIAEQSKISFSTNGTVTIYDKDIDGQGSSIDCTLEKDEFERIIFPVVEQTIELTAKAIAAARKKPSQLSRILLVGGSSRLGLVRTLLEDRFPSCAVDGRLEPDLAVSWGAALQAAMIMGQNPHTILVDVCSHSLGIGVVEDATSAEKHFKEVLKEFGVHTIGDPKFSDIKDMLGDKAPLFEEKLQGKLNFAKIIFRNSPLPAKKSEFFKTIFDNQQAIQVVIAQGEGPTVGDGKFIGSFFFELEQPCEAGTKCEVQLTYDANGMVGVLARQHGTQNEAQAHFDSRTGEVLGWKGVSDDTTVLGKSKASVNDESPMLINTFVINIQKVMKSGRLSPQDAISLSQIFNKYQDLLKNAANGALVDDELEELESQMMALAGEML